MVNKAYHIALATDGMWRVKYPPLIPQIWQPILTWSAMEN